MIESSIRTARVLNHVKDWCLHAYKCVCVYARLRIGNSYQQIQLGQWKGLLVRNRLVHRKWIKSSYFFELRTKLYRLDGQTINQLNKSESASLLQDMSLFLPDCIHIRKVGRCRTLPQQNPIVRTLFKSFEIKYEIWFSMRLMFRGHLQWRNDLDLLFISGEYLG